VSRARRRLRAASAAGVALVLAAALAGCGLRLGRLAVMTTTDADPADAEGPAHDVEGRSCVTVAVVFPVSSLPSIERAVDDALAQRGGRILRDVELGYEIRYLPLLFGRACYVVRGRAS
jgi:hypothetical protein